MKPLMFLVLMAALPVLPAQATQAGQLCVTNAADRPFFFAVTDANGQRHCDTLAPNTRLCLDSDTRGIVSVFETTEAFEGCSRLVDANGSDDMIAYAPFDRCEWASHHR